jgi:Cys-tRNA(Pro)/Cys-tRNA(Cys) deacylase
VASLTQPTMPAPHPIEQTGLVTPAIRLLQAAGVDFEIHEYDRGDELRDFGREAADALGLPFEQVFKTLLLDVEGGDAPADPIVVVVPVSCMVSMKLAAAAVGSKKAAMCDPERAERITGYVVGGISPLGQRKRLRTVLDETVELFDLIYVSGGRRGLDIAVSPADLARLLDAIIAPITA